MRISITTDQGEVLQIIEGKEIEVLLKGKISKEDLDGPMEGLYGFASDEMIIKHPNAGRELGMFVRDAVIDEANAMHLRGKPA